MWNCLLMRMKRANWATLLAQMANLLTHRWEKLQKTMFFQLQSSCNQRTCLAAQNQSLGVKRWLCGATLSQKTWKCGGKWPKKGAHRNCSIGVLTKQTSSRENSLVSDQSFASLNTIKHICDWWCVSHWLGWGRRQWLPQKAPPTSVKDCRWHCSQARALIGWIIGVAGEQRSLHNVCQDLSETSAFNKMES